jgi:hypothetical protein
MSLALGTRSDWVLICGEKIERFISLQGYECDISTFMFDGYDEINVRNAIKLHSLENIPLMSSLGDMKE